MKDIKHSKTSPIAIKDNSEIKDVIEADTSKAKSATNTNDSSQMQLLGLAKSFVLDGGLLSLEKQMPLEDRTQRRARIGPFENNKTLKKLLKSHCRIVLLQKLPIKQILIGSVLLLSLLKRLVTKPCKIYGQKYLQVR